MPLLVLAALKWLGGRALSLIRRTLLSQVRRLRFTHARKLSRGRKSAYVVECARLRANSYYTLFLLAVTAYYFALVLFPAFGSARPAITVLLLLPALVFEAAWLFTDSFAKALFIARGSLLKNARAARRDA